MNRLGYEPSHEGTLGSGIVVLVGAFARINKRTGGNKHILVCPFTDP